MLPVSGAEQLKTIGATPFRPISSQSIPYSQLVSPGPKRSSGRNRFQRPSAFARSRSSTRISGYGDARPHLAVERLDGLALDGIDVLLHELADAVEEGRDAVRRCEIHGRGAYSAAQRALEQQPGDSAVARPPPSAITAASTSGRRGRARLARWSGARSAWSSTSRAVSAPASGTSTSRGPAARKSGTSKPARAAQHARHALLEQQALDQLGLGLVAPARHAHELALGVDAGRSCARARAPRSAAPRAARRRRARAACRSSGRSSRPTSSSRPQPGQASGGQPSTTSSSSSSTRPSAIRHARTTGLALQRHDQVAPVRVGREVDVGLRRLGRAARVRVVDADLEALVVELVRREQALVVELVAVGRVARVLGALDALDRAVRAPTGSRSTRSARRRARARPARPSGPARSAPRRRLVCGRMAPSAHAARGARRRRGRARPRLVRRRRSAARRRRRGRARAPALLGSLLALERAVVAAYGACVEVLRGEALRSRRARSARRSASTPRGSSGLIRDLGGDAAARPQRRGVRAHASRGCGRPADALRFAEDLEERQVRAYLEALTELPDARAARRGGRASAPTRATTSRAVARAPAGCPRPQGPFVTGAL